MAFSGLKVEIRASRGLAERERERHREREERDESKICTAANQV